MNTGGRPSATVTRRIEFVDTDASGRYHYATAMRLFEAAESELLDQLGLLDGIYTSTPRARVAFDYHHVLGFRDEVRATAWVAALGRTSVTYGFELKRGPDLCVSGELVAVYVDEEGRPRPWDEAHRRLLDPDGAGAPAG